MTKKGKKKMVIRKAIICSRCRKSFPLMVVDNNGMLICRECMKWKPFVDSIAELIRGEKMKGER
jgi:uncharacterized protein YbaR (Trm112 family)